MKVRVTDFDFASSNQFLNTFVSMNRVLAHGFLYSAIMAGSVLSCDKLVNAEAPAISSQQLVVTANELRSAKIIGDLGLPLGTLMSIDGEYRYVPDDPRTKTNEEALMLNILYVNGVKLKHPICTYSSGSPWISVKRRNQLDGQPFRLRGYEFGHILGDVKDADAYEPIIAKAPTPFGLRLDFAVVHMTNPPPSSLRPSVFSRF